MFFDGNNVIWYFITFIVAWEFSRPRRLKVFRLRESREKSRASIKKNNNNRNFRDSGSFSASDFDSYWHQWQFFRRHRTGRYYIGGRPSNSRSRQTNNRSKNYPCARNDCMTESEKGSLLAQWKYRHFIFCHTRNAKSSSSSFAQGVKFGATLLDWKAVGGRCFYLFMQWVMQIEGR